MHFEDVLLGLENGVTFSRLSWEVENKFIFKQIPAEIDIEKVPHMTSLPNEVKDIFGYRKNFGEETGFNPYFSIRYKNQLAVVHGDNSITSYVPSVEDLYADDWVEYVSTLPGNKAEAIMEFQTDEEKGFTIKVSQASASDVDTFFKSLLSALNK